MATHELPGAQAILLSEWLKLAKRDPSRANGPSPGGAAFELGISRQAIHKLIARGNLDAWRVIDDRTGKLRAIVVVGSSLQRLKRLRPTPEHGVRIGRQLLTS